MDSAPRDPKDFETIRPPAEKVRPRPPSAPPSASQPPATPPSQPAFGSNAPRPAGDVHKTEIYKGHTHTRTIRGYQLLDELGGGAYGVVYRALSPGGVEVAIKEVRYSLSRPESKRELDALELIKSLHHPYLLNLHDFWSENDRLYIAMELADSSLGQLADKHEGRELPAAGLLPIFEEAAEALDFLHLNRVLHRDIKPANVLLLRGHAKVADMGLAKSNPESVAVSQNVVGTPAFMAPETLKKEFRPESDQYALALCYGELRLGRPICEGANMYEVIRWQMLGVPNLEGLASYEEAAVRKALEKEPSLRFRSCGAFIEALQPPLIASSTYQALPEPVTRPRPASRWWAAGLAALAVGALVGLAAKMFGPGTPPPPEPLLWLPPGCSPAEEAVLMPEGDRRCYNRIVRKIGNLEVEFLLIPHEKSEDPRTFYIMRDKVWNGLFKAAAGDPAKGNAPDPGFQREIGRYRPLYPPTMTWGDWPKGGTRTVENTVEDVGSNDDSLPVLRVNLLEAMIFARWMEGSLPTVSQWDAAGGWNRDCPAPFIDPKTPPVGDDLAVGRVAKGPMPVGAAKRDESFFHCRDMAGNGEEWTVTPAQGDSTFRPSSPPKDPFFQVVIRGQSYKRNDPFRFDMPADFKEIRECNSAVGFRVVVEVP